MLSCPPLGYITCSACCGSGGRTQRVRRCPMAVAGRYGSCCCTGCYRWEFVTCWKCCGYGYVAAPRWQPQWPLPRPAWPPLPPPCLPYEAQRPFGMGNARADAAAARR